jgi:hypothetical protein
LALQPGAIADDWVFVDGHAGNARDQSDRPQDLFVAEFRMSVVGTDVHARVRAAAMRAAKNLGIEERLVAKLPPAAEKPGPD